MRKNNSGFIYGMVATLLALPTIAGGVIAAVPSLRDKALNYGAEHSQVYQDVVANNETLTAENEDLQAELDQANIDKAALQTRVTTLTNEKTSLQTQVTTLTGEKTTLQGQVTSLTNDKTTLQGQVTTLTNDKANLQAQVNEKITQIATLNARIDELLAQAEENANEFKYGRYVSSIVDSNGKYTDTLINVSDDGTGTLSYFNNEGGLDTEPFTYVVEENNILATFNVEGETFEYELVLSGNSFDMTVEDETPMHFVECNDDLFNAISSRNMVSNEVVDLSNQILSKDNEISNLNAEIENKNNEISNLNNEISNLNNEISNLNAVISGKGDQIITLNEEIETLNARIDELESQSGNQSQGDILIDNVREVENVIIFFDHSTISSQVNQHIDVNNDNTSYRITTPESCSHSSLFSNYCPGGSNDDDSLNSFMITKKTYADFHMDDSIVQMESSEVQTSFSVSANVERHLYLNGTEYTTKSEMLASKPSYMENFYFSYNIEYTLENSEITSLSITTNINCYDTDPYSDPNYDPTGGEETLYGIQTDVTYKDDSSSESTIIFHSDGTFDYVRDDDTVSGTYDVMDTNYYTLYTNDNSVEFGHFTPTSENSFVLNGFTYTIV